MLIYTCVRVHVRVRLRVRLRVHVRVRVRLLHLMAAGGSSSMSLSDPATSNAERVFMKAVVDDNVHGARAVLMQHPNFVSRVSCCGLLVEILWGSMEIKINH